jgi:ADP-ribosyl-[dinitrogen reductase] hydrolase
MSATNRNDRSANSGRQRTELTLVDLLNQDQPYKHFRQLNDPELEISHNGKDDEKIRRIQGSIVGLAIGDALGAPVEFRPNTFMKENQVKGMQSGGTWGLERGQWTDDTSMALCLAASLIVKGKFNPYDQFVRYRKWFREGYMSSTGKCFDIGKSTREAITDFENRQQKVRNEIHKKNKKPDDSDLDDMIEREMRKSNNGFNLGTPDSAGNGPLMRLAPIPCFFSDSYQDVMNHIDEATQLTHGDPRAIDACRFYAGLIWHALQGVTKKQLLDQNFYRKFFKLEELHPDIRQIAEGSYKNKKGYEEGIRGKGYIVNALEAALWAFYNDNDEFKEGVLLAVNLGDDTDTTAAIYGELAGAVYGIDNIPSDWIEQLYEGKFILTVAKGLYIKREKSRTNPQKSDWSDETGRNRSESNASGNNKTRHDQRSDATNISNTSQKTDTDGASNQTGQKNTGGKSSTNSSSSNETGGNRGEGNARGNSNTRHDQNSNATNTSNTSQKRDTDGASNQAGQTNTGDKSKIDSSSSNDTGPHVFPQS